MGGDYQKFLSQASKPTYGAPQQAQFMGNLNDLANSSINTLRQNMAKSGTMDSGRMASGLTGILNNRNTQASQYMANVPMMNQQAYMQNMGQALGLGMNWTGRDPLSTMTVGNQNMTQNGTEHGTQMGTGQSQTFGPPASSGFLNNIGGMLGAGAGGKGPFGSDSLTGIFGKSLFGKG